jgi:hypothetical protein
VFPPTPGSICGWCDFRRSCPAGAQRPGNEPWTAVERAAATSSVGDDGGPPDLIL